MPKAIQLTSFFSAPEASLGCSQHLASFIVGGRHILQVGLALGLGTDMLRFCRHIACLWMNQMKPIKFGVILVDLLKICEHKMSKADSS